MKLGLDLHGVIDACPELFSHLSHLLRHGEYFPHKGIYVKNEVHIITGSSITSQIKDQLKEYQIWYTHLFSITDYHTQIFERLPDNHPEKELHRVTWDAQGRPWMDSNIWDKTKADYCAENKIDLHLDDTEKYGHFFTTPFSKFNSKK